MKKRHVNRLVPISLAFLLAWVALVPLVAVPPAEKGRAVNVKILAINDFHGRLSQDPNAKAHDRPVGSAAVLAAYLRAAQQEMPDRTVVVEAGDLVGASPAVCALGAEQPAFDFMKLLAAPVKGRPGQPAPGGGVVGTVGNHEFDKGVAALMRLVRGGGKGPANTTASSGPRADFSLVCANVIDRKTGRTLFPPFVVKRLGGIPVAFVGAVTRTTPNELLKSRVEGLDFQDEADTVNAAVKILKKQGIRSVVVLLHQGGRQPEYEGPTDPAREGVSGEELLSIVARLDPEVDVVVSGHSHGFSNALLKNAAGQAVLVTQSYSYGRAFAEIDLEIDRATGDVTRKSANVRLTYADAGPGLKPDPETAAFVRAAEEKVRPVTSRPVGQAPKIPLGRKDINEGESVIGDLIADSHRAAGGTDFAFTNPTGIRADIYHEMITWGDLFAIQPFQNALVRMELSGEDVVEILRQQWGSQYGLEMLQVSGLHYEWQEAQDRRERVKTVCDAAGKPLEAQRTYTVTVNEFLAQGGNSFSVFRDRGKNRQIVKDAAGKEVRDVDALVSYVQGPLKGVVTAPEDYGRRIRRVSPESEKGPGGDSAR